MQSVVLALCVDDCLSRAFAAGIDEKLPGTDVRNASSMQEYNDFIAQTAEDFTAQIIPLCSG